MKTKHLFYSLLIAFAIMLFFFFMQPFFYFAAFFGLIVTILGIMLIIKARKIKNKPARRFLYLTGVGASGILVCSILHNLVYALFIVLFGQGFWKDEPVFFIIALIICPLLFLIGTIGTFFNLKKIK
ncbi:hypothetical protein JW930_02065 [Candidatus Woesearchaeota archaeon]|nr:hypothetical protein [Candidatus Woesearchaeota archaeon]